MATIRADKFQSGDHVTFIDLDDYTDDSVLQNHWRQFGRGPYVVEDIEDASPYLATSPSICHTQFVWVNGERYSGYWFKPVRETNES